MKQIFAALASLPLAVAFPSLAEASSKAVADGMQSVAPALAADYEERVLGEVWKRPGLSARDRSIATLAALIAKSHTAKLDAYVHRAIDNGVQPAEISEIITHLAYYSGWGTASAAAPIVEKVFEVRKIQPAMLPQLGAYKLPLNEAAEAEREKRVAATFGSVFPGVTQYTTDYLFKDLWLRSGLMPRDRSLVTISALIASGGHAQLAGHLNIGMNNGLTQAELSEAFTHLAFYAGWPNVFTAMPIAKDVFEKRAK